MRGPKTAYISPMQPKTPDFETKASRFLENLAENLDGQVGDVVDVDLSGGVLTLELLDGRQYVINKHQPMQQVWLSSPVSGAWHFDPNGNDWLATKGSGSFSQMLSEELSILLQREVRL